VTVDAVTFESDGLLLAGDLRRPSAPLDPLLPALVFTGPFTGVKEQVVGLYADLLARAGFITLVFDHRNFGASEGAPRQHEAGAGKLADLTSATSYLCSVAGVDPERVGCVGICLGAGYALRHAAFDPRIRALVTIAGAYNDPRVMRANFGIEAYRETLARHADVAQRQHDTGQIEYLPAVSLDGEAAMAGAEPYEYYGTHRGQAESWENRISVLSLRELITIDNATSAEFIAPTPWCLIHGRTDDFCAPDDARRVFERAGEPKAIHWVDTTNHIDLYDRPTYVEPAAAIAAEWLHEHLGRRSIAGLPE
jgi:fermentation-respiration switch protein FrsA (DUF1100 family)